MQDEEPPRLYVPDAHSVSNEPFHEYPGGTGEQAELLQVNWTVTTNRVIETGNKEVWP